ncbi:uncharacterized protein LOC130777994 [Actinidia eriantha]|uniref:uncharacterized protein LOC130777994 n=1 Tax=Actinidia eriantha TaxID=165200 RepID=UPI002586C6C7|nr:uncharacterized protein LOC130777994 [Actinidia eriantha]
MAFSACFCPSQISFKINCSTLVTRPPLNQRSVFALKRVNTELYGQRDVVIRSKLIGDWSFVGGSRIVIRPNPRRTHLNRKSFRGLRVLKLLVVFLHWEQRPFFHFTPSWFWLQNLNW